MGTERPACLPPRTRSRREVGGRRSTPNASKWAKLGPGRGGEGELDVDLNLPLIPESQYPILFAAIPSSHARESPSVRRSCCASFLRYRLFVCPSLSALPTPFALPSQIHNVFRCALLSFPRKIMYLPNYTLLATLGRATRRRRGINERIIGCRS